MTIPQLLPIRHPAQDGYKAAFIPSQKVELQHDKDSFLSFLYIRTIHFEGWRVSRQSFLRLDGVTKAERIQMTACVSEAINQAGAWITDFHQYSNVLICINFQALSTDLGKLAETLQATDLYLSQESLEQLMSAHDSTLDEKELVGTLQITFVHNEPDLLRDVPAVPG